jgi:hypothetical protein
VSVAERARIRRATLAARRALETLDDVGREELTRIYGQAAAALRDTIARSGDNAGKVTIDALRSVLAQVEGILENVAVTRDGVVTAGIMQAAEIGAAGAGLESAAAMRVATTAVDFVRHFVAQDGLMLSDRLWRVDRGAREEITRAVESAVVQGHGSAQAAREFLARGQAVPAEIAARLGAADSAALGSTAERLMKGERSALYQAQRVFRTEINRAHGEAFMAGADQNPDFAGFRFLLSPGHPKPDICDLLASQNLYGLGPGVYPSREKCPWPAHPNTLSYVEVVYKDEVSAEDKAGKELPMAALNRLPREVQDGVLGKGKAEIYRDGKLSQGMIRSTLGAVKRRVGA